MDYPERIRVNFRDRTINFDHNVGIFDPEKYDFKSQTKHYQQIKGILADHGLVFSKVAVNRLRCDPGECCGALHKEDTPVQLITYIEGTFDTPLFIWHKTGYHNDSNLNRIYPGESICNIRMFLDQPESQYATWFEAIRLKAWVMTDTSVK